MLISPPLTKIRFFTLTQCKLDQDKRVSTSPIIWSIRMIIETLRLHDADSNGNAEMANKLGARTSLRRTLPAF